VSHEEFSIPFRPAHYDGYQAYSYLRPGVDYPEIVLAPSFGRVPLYDLGLDEEQTVRTIRLIDDNIVISLHDHPQRFPADMTQLREYNRGGRQFTSYEGLARSGLTAVFDNMMDGTGCIVSHTGWSWEDTIYDIGMRLADLVSCVLNSLPN
jgi:membrane dipeptidase